MTRYDLDKMRSTTHGFQILLLLTLSKGGI